MSSILGRFSPRSCPFVLFAIVCAAAVLPARRVEAQLQFTGVNLAGAEFGAPPTPTDRGVYGDDYTYPTNAEVDYFVSHGMNTFRLPFRWERLQPTLNSALNTTEFNRLNNFVTYATSRGANVILDPHNFGRYYPDPNDFESSTQGLIGTASVPNSAFADLWSRLATNYKSNSHVIFGLMTEPNTESTELWVSSANAALSAIRATGASNLVLVPGSAWTGASTWSDNWYGTPNAQAMLNIVDPGNNYAFEVHQYLDADGSGTSAQIYHNDPTIGVTRLTGFTNWLSAHLLHGFLGEFGVANSMIGMGASQIGDETLTNMLNFMEAHPDQWLGWNWWAAGPWWQDYLFTLEPQHLGKANQTDQPAMTVLQAHTFGVTIPGDVNLDGVVNAADITVMASHWLQRGAGTAGDANHDGVVNAADITVAASNWLHSAPAHSAAATSVPEPPAFALAAIGTALVCGMRHRALRRARG